MTDFESYIRQGEPGQRERANNWSIAIGLQAVDGLTPSEYLINSARQNIEGLISLDEVRQRINAYYQSKEGRELRNRYLHIRTAEILPQSANTGDKNNEIGDKSAINPEIGDKKQQILAFISSHGEVKADDVAKHIGLGASRTRDYLKQLVEEGKLLAMGANKNRTYKLR